MSLRRAQPLWIHLDVTYPHVFKVVSDLGSRVVILLRIDDPGFK